MGGSETGTKKEPGAIDPAKQTDIKNHELKQITPRKVPIPDTEIPESKHTA